MKILKAALPAALILIVLNGCSSYQLSSETKKVSVESISPNTITVTFCGNAYMSQEEVEKYALQRASEETLAKGYAYFLVMSKQDNSKVCELNYGMKTAQPSDSTALTTQKSLSSSVFVQPNVSLTIRCLSAGEKLPEKAIDARKFLRENFPGLYK